MPLDKPLATSTLKMIKRGRSAGRERIDASLCKTRQAGRKKGTLPCHNGCACMSTKMMLDVLSLNASVDSKHASKRTHADHVKGPRDKTRPPGRKKDLSYIMPRVRLRGGLKPQSTRRTCCDEGSDMSGNLLVSTVRLHVNYLVSRCVPEHNATQSNADCAH